MFLQYGVAQICENGHVVNDASDLEDAYNEKFCSRCGAKTITVCGSCESPIRGRTFKVVQRFGPQQVGVRLRKPPSFCFNCGTEFPWTSRRIAAAAAISRESAELDPAEQRELEVSLQAIVRDTPESQVAASRLGKLMKKLGAGTARAVRDIAVDIASEAAKKILLPS